MIEVSRAAQSRHEGLLASGITSWMRGGDGPEAVAAAELVAETVIMWRLLMNSRIEKG